MCCHFTTLNLNFTKNVVVNVGFVIWCIYLVAFLKTNFVQLCRFASKHWLFAHIFYAANIFKKYKFYEIICKNSVCVSGKKSYETNYFYTKRQLVVVICVCLRIPLLTAHSTFTTSRIWIQKFSHTYLHISNKNCPIFVEWANFKMLNVQICINLTVSLVNLKKFFQCGGYANFRDVVFYLKFSFSCLQHL